MWVWGSFKYPTGTWTLWYRTCHPQEDPNRQHQQVAFGHDAPWLAVRFYSALSASPAVQGMSDALRGRTCRRSSCSAIMELGLRNYTTCCLIFGGRFQNGTLIGPFGTGASVPHPCWKGFWKRLTRPNLASAKRLRS